MKLDLLTNAAVVDDAVRFVFAKSKDKEGKLKSLSTNEDEREESNQSYYGEPEGASHTTVITTNEVF